MQFKTLANIQHVKFGDLLSLNINIEEFSPSLQGLFKHYRIRALTASDTLSPPSVLNSSPSWIFCAFLVTLVPP
jgi:hypothetical protein